jgi:hypothetical protein
MHPENVATLAVRFAAGKRDDLVQRVAATRDAIGTRDRWGSEECSGE